MRLERRLARDPDSAAEARRALGEISDHLSPRRLEDAQLLVSELVTNAIRHADLAPDEGIRLIVEESAAGLRVEVHDPGRGFDWTGRDRGAEEPGGWGLYLVETLADRWGVDRNDVTTVWFEVDAMAVQAA
jgi:anti-sigma regulatory factor (Ser/Thr protein kinase)